MADQLNYLGSDTLHEVKRSAFVQRNGLPPKDELSGRDKSRTPMNAADKNRQRSRDELYSDASGSEHEHNSRRIPKRKAVTTAVQLANKRLRA